MNFQHKNTLKKPLKFPKIFSKFLLPERPVSGRWAKLLMLKNLRQQTCQHSQKLNF